MATIVQHPTTLNRVTDVLCFIFNMSDIGDGETTQKKLWYQLFCEDGTPAMVQPKSYLPKATGNLPQIDFSREIEKFLTCKTPNFGTSTSWNDAEELKKKFYVEYYEETITTDPEAETCVTSEEGSKEKSDVFEVLNSAVQWWEHDVIGILTSRPKYYCLCEDAEDFLYLCRDGAFGGTMNITAYYTDGTSGNVASVGAGGEIGYWGMGPYNIWGNNVPANLSHYVVQASNNEQFHIGIKCCCEKNITLYFKEHQGGYAAMSFCCIDDIQFASNHTEYCAANEKGRPYSQQQRHNGDFQILEKDSREIITMHHRITDCTWRDIRWVHNLLASKKALAQLPDFAGLPITVDFRIASNQVVTYEKEKIIDITITGYINQTYNLPI